MCTSAQNWSSGGLVDIEERVRVCEEDEADFAFFREAREVEPVWEAILSICFIVWVAPLAWRHVRACAGIFEEVEVNALSGLRSGCF